MEPIVLGIRNKYVSCIKLERMNFHDRIPWHDLLFPFDPPEFVLLSHSKEVLYRWFGYAEEAEFAGYSTRFATVKKYRPQGLLAKPLGSTTFGF